MSSLLPEEIISCPWCGDGRLRSGRGEPRGTRKGRDKEAETISNLRQRMRETRSLVISFEPLGLTCLKLSLAFA